MKTSLLCTSSLAFLSASSCFFCLSSSSSTFLLSSLFLFSSSSSTSASCCLCLILSNSSLSWSSRRRFSSSSLRSASRRAESSWSSPAGNSGERSLPRLVKGTHKHGSVHKDAVSRTQSWHWIQDEYFKIHLKGVSVYGQANTHTKIKKQTNINDPFFVRITLQHI